MDVRGARPSRDFDVHWPLRSHAAIEHSHSSCQRSGDLDIASHLFPLKEFGFDHGRQRHGVLERHDFAAKFLMTDTEFVRQPFLEQLTGARVRRRKFFDELQAEGDRVGDVERDQALRRWAGENLFGAGRIEKEIHLRRSGGVARVGQTTTADDDPVDQLDRGGVPAREFGQVRQRAQANDCDFTGMPPKQIRHHLFAGIFVLAGRRREVTPGQPVGTVEVAVVKNRRVARRRCRSDSRIACRIELGNDRGGIDIGLARVDRASGRGDGQYVEPGIEQRHRDSNGVVNPRVAVQYDFFCHVR